MFWAGWNDRKDEGKFAHALTGKELKREDGYWPWYPGEPNGGVLENCAVVWVNRDAWNDYMCFEKAFGYCLIQPRPNLILRGRWILHEIEISIFVKVLSFKGCLQSCSAYLIAGIPWLQTSLSMDITVLTAILTQKYFLTTLPESGEWNSSLTKIREELLTSLTTLMAAIAGIC